MSGFHCLFFLWRFLKYSSHFLLFCSVSSTGISNFSQQDPGLQHTTHKVMCPKSLFLVPQIYSAFRVVFPFAFWINPCLCPPSSWRDASWCILSTHANLFLLLALSLLVAHKTRKSGVLLTHITWLRSI